MTAQPGACVIRADTGPGIGIGHLMRSLALGEAWRRGGDRVVAVTQRSHGALPDWAVEAGLERHAIDHRHPDRGDLTATLGVLESLRGPDRPAWLVLDGYQFDGAYQRAIRAGGFSLLVMDDMAHLPRYEADVVVNPNLGAERLSYRCPGDTLLLRGPGYACLRAEFLAHDRPARRYDGDARRVLLTLGGDPPVPLVHEILVGLDTLSDDLEVVVALGPYGAAGAVRALAPRRRQRVQVADRPRMAELMVWADLAVSAAGGTCWELAFTGLPGVLVVLAENQRRIAAGLADAGVAVDLGAAATLTGGQVAQAVSGLLRDPERRARMGAAGRALVDGRGAARLLDAVRAHAAHATRGGRHA